MKKRLLLYAGDNGACCKFRVTLPASFLDRTDWEYRELHVMNEEDILWCLEADKRIAIFQRANNSNVFTNLEIMK